MADNQSTIRPSSDESVPSDQFLQPALTILFHPRLDRVGSIAWLEPKAQLSRNEPEFIDDHGNRSPLQDPVISRRPVQLERLDSGNYSVRCDSAGQQVRVDGQRLVDPLGLTPDDLESGVVLEIADRVVLLWHLSRPRSPLPAQPDRADPMPSDMIGRNHLMLDVHDEIRRVATLDLPVLIRGESGVGKELVARAIHGHSRRKNKPFVSINMGAVSSGTALSELFGHRRGAFTGAGGGRDGYFGQADTGTLFLDEIVEASSEVQVMLLRAIETGEIRPIGAHG
ncbi:MAG: sigma-54 factor interaction domain-containing protein, partial [Myxococcota bacterium]